VKRVSLKIHPFFTLPPGQREDADHLLVCRSLLAYYKGSEVHDELLHDETIAFATERKFPESDHTPVIAEFELPDQGL
jgi:exonuclease III